jgi:recombination protein RecA
MYNSVYIKYGEWEDKMASDKGKKDRDKVTEPITDEVEKLKALDKAMSDIQKSYGKGSIMRLGENASMEIDVISTGCVGLDMAIGVGGLPRGRIAEIYGPESSGKTTVALHCVAEAQKIGGIAAFIDAEHALDPVYAKALGVDVDNLIISQPDNGEQALEIAEALIRSGAIDIIVIDSVAALVPKAEIEGEMGDSQIGLQARLMSKALRKLTGSIKRFECVAIFINQLREKVGVMFGNPETTTGGRALKFYSTVRLEVRRSDAIKQGDRILGNRTKIKVVKNKVAPPFKQIEVDILYGEGISRIGDLVDVATDIDIINKSGSWFSYKDSKIGQGREKVKQFLLDNKEIMDDIEAQVREYYNKDKVVEEELKVDGKDDQVDEKDTEDELDDLDLLALDIESLKEEL